MIHKTHLSPANSRDLQELLTHLLREREHYIGFPVAFDFDYHELAPLLQQSLNNVGDPTTETLHRLSSKAIEREVLAFFAKLFRAPADDWWGYVTNGSTECNLYALYAARQKLPAAKVYYSTAAHYSIPKNIHILAQEGVAIPAADNGEMDYKALEKELQQNGGEAIVVATIGTTMTEARDNVVHIRGALERASITNYFIHSDAALAGTYTAFARPRHPFDFADGADSINISGHKFIGSPIPCGVILTKKQDKERLGGSMNYTGSADTTISGSRNGHTPLFLWYAIKRWGTEGLKRRAIECMALAAYTTEQLKQTGWPSWRNPDALTVVLATPPDNLATKWQLASYDGWSHVICMPGVTRAKIDEFVIDISQASQAKRKSTLRSRHSGLDPESSSSLTTR